MRVGTRLCRPAALRDAREAVTAFLEKRKPDFTKSNGVCEAKRGIRRRKATRSNMKTAAQAGMVRVASAANATKWGVFQTLAFAAIRELRAGRMVVVVDDEDRGTKAT